MRPFNTLQFQYERQLKKRQEEWNALKHHNTQHNFENMRSSSIEHSSSSIPNNRPLKSPSPDLKNKSMMFPTMSPENLCMKKNLQISANKSNRNSDAKPNYFKGGKGGTSLSFTYNNNRNEHSHNHNPSHIFYQQSSDQSHQRQNSSHSHTVTKRKNISAVSPLSENQQELQHQQRITQNSPHNGRRNKVLNISTGSGDQANSFIRNEYQGIRQYDSSQSPSHSVNHHQNQYFSTPQRVEQNNKSSQKHPSPAPTPTPSPLSMFYRQTAPQRHSQLQRNQNVMMSRQHEQERNFLIETIKRKDMELEGKERVIHELKDMLAMITQNGNHLKNNSKRLGDGDGENFTAENYESMKNRVKILTIQNQKLVQIIDKEFPENNRLSSYQQKYSSRPQSQQQDSFGANNQSSSKRVDSQSDLEKQCCDEKIANEKLRAQLLEKEKSYEKEKSHKSLALQCKFYQSEKEKYRKENDRLMNLLKLKEEEKQIESQGWVSGSQSIKANSNKTSTDNKMSHQNAEIDDEEGGAASSLMPSVSPTSTERLSVQKIKEQYQQSLKQYKQNVYNEIENMFETISSVLEEINEKLNIFEDRIVKIEENGLRKWAKRTMSQQKVQRDNSNEEAQEQELSSRVIAEDEHIRSSSLSQNREEFSQEYDFSLKKSAIYIEQAPPSTDRNLQIIEEQEDLSERILEKKRANSEDNDDNLEEQLRECVIEKEYLREENKKLEEALERRERELMDEILELQKLIESEDEEKKQFIGKMESELNEKLQLEKEQHQKQLEYIKKFLRDLEGKFSQLQREKDQIEEKLRNVELQREKKQWENEQRTKAVQQQLQNQKQQQLIRVQKVHDDQLSALKAQLEATIDSKQKQISSLREKYCQLQSRLKIQSSRYQEVQKDFSNRIEERLQSIRNQENEVSDQRDASEPKTSQLQSILDHFREIQIQSELLKVKEVEAMKKLKESAALIDKLRKEIFEKQEQIFRLQGDLIQSRQKIGSLESKNKNYERELDKRKLICEQLLRQSIRQESTVEVEGVENQQSSDPKGENSEANEGKDIIGGSIDYVKSLEAIIEREKSQKQELMGLLEGLSLSTRFKKQHKEVSNEVIQGHQKLFQSQNQSLSQEGEKRRTQSEELDANE